MTLRALWNEPHHDGSALYVSNPSPDLGETVTVFLRAPHEAGATQAHVRVVRDGEPLWVSAKIDRDDGVETWYRAHIPIGNPVTSYRWLTDGGPHDYRWINGMGSFGHDVTDEADFRLTTYEAAPAWASDAIVYHIFPDRFARSTDRPAPDWALPQAWDDPVEGYGPNTSRQWYGGDLDGIRAHLDHLESMSVNTVYLTPIFPAHSNHRYDAASFDAVDPALGGDAALARLSEAVHARGMRLLGDLTTNHSGVTHDWFRRAAADGAGVEAGFYLFERHPDDYVSWLGVPSLPKLNHGNAELRRRLYDGPDSVVASWLRPPANLDGWRIDVANMTGRHDDVDLNHEVAVALRATLRAAAPDALLLAEHGHDYTRDLMGDGWHGTMNYAGFARPLWSWLRPQTGAADVNVGLPLATPRLPGQSIVATMRQFGAAVPWEVARHNLNFLSTHDSPRTRTLLGSAASVAVAAGLLAALPGIPSLYSGDEIGLEGTNGEDGRRPFPWDPARWDRPTLAAWRRALALRRDLTALRHGGLRWLEVTDDTLVFLRETAEQRVLVAANRGATDQVRLPARHLGNGQPLTGLAGTADLEPDRNHLLSLPTDGPAIRLWLVP